MSFAFENLNVYQKLVDFADKICELTSRFPRGFFFLANQMNRASLSISTNIAEGNGQFTKAERKHFFGIARGSVQECVPLLELAKRRSLVTSEADTHFRENLEEIAKMLSGLINGLEKREK
jgi:four helix bundle protein